MLAATFSQLSAFDKSGKILLFAALFIIAVIVVSGILTGKFNRNKLGDFYKYAIGIALGFALLAAALMTTLKIDEMITSSEIIPPLFYPLLAVIALAVIGAVGAFIINLIRPQKLKAYFLIMFGLFTAGMIICLVFMSIYYVREIIPGGYYSDVSSIGLAVCAAFLSILIAALALLFGRRMPQSTKSVVYAAVCIALSFALSYIRLFKLPQGGSVTLVSTLPIMLYSYIFGIRKGIVAGAIYGLLQAVQDPWIIHPAQFLLDYPIAFAALGLAGILREVKLFSAKPVLAFALGAVAAGFLRYVCHVMSGIFAFASYAGAGYGAVEWGFLYNSFALVDLAIAAAASIPLFASKSFYRLVESIKA